MPNQLCQIHSSRNIPLSSRQQFTYCSLKSGQMSKVDKCQMSNGILSSWLLRGMAKYVKVEPMFGKGSLHPQKRMIFRRFSKRPLTCMHDLFCPSTRITLGNLSHFCQNFQLGFHLFSRERKVAQSVKFCGGDLVRKTAASGNIC